FFQVRVQNYYPYEFLGHFDYIFMFGKLYEEREDHSDPNILFLRLNFKPSTSFEIGLNRALMYGGEGRPQYKLKEYPKLIIGRDETIGGRFDNDSYFGFDVKFDIPIKFFDTFQLYYERNATDIESPFKKGDPQKLHFPFIILKFHDDAKTYGIRAKRGKILVNAEYTETAKTMYLHHRYPKEGFTYHGFPLGYPYGRNVRHAFLLLESLGDKEKFSVELGYIGQPAKFRGNIERRRMESVYTAFNVGKKVNKFNLDLYFRVDNVKNLNLSETPVQINLAQGSKLLFSTGFAVGIDF
ncbi:MAG: capsule assembly Wzi family protein, partial [Candidatus Aenigmatarchaeota archaeon]